MYDFDVLFVSVLSIVVITAVTIGWYYRQSTEWKNTDNTTHSKSELKKNEINHRPLKISNEPKFDLSKQNIANPNDVWEERRKKGIAIANSRKSVVAGSGKPFGSSYYYAHNNHQSKGGYSDGLRMEDYTMNGPRLLSKNGTPINSFAQGDGNQNEHKEDDNDHHENNDSDEADHFNNDERLPSSTLQDTTKIIMKPRREISKYLWDDAGDKDFGTIRIDSVPGKFSTDKMLPWNELEVTEIQSTLTERGLKIHISTQHIDYEFIIKELYGKVSRVETVSKSKRLIVRLYKAEKTRGNLKAWPQPHKKIA